MSLSARILILNKSFDSSTERAFLVIKFEDGRVEEVDVSPHGVSQIPDVGSHIFITYSEGPPLTIHQHSTTPPVGMSDPDVNFVTKDLPIILVAYGALSFFANPITSIGLVVLMMGYGNTNSPEGKSAILALSMICCAGNAFGWFYFLYFGGILAIVGIIMGGIGLFLMGATLCASATKFRVQ